LLLGGFAAGAAETVPVGAVAIAIDGAASVEPPRRPGDRQVWEQVAAQLGRQGFAVLAADPEDRLGADLLARAEIGRLDVDLRPPSFRFHAVWLPPRWTRTQVGLLRLVEERSGRELWQEKLEVPLSVPEGEPRREAAIAAVGPAIAALRPARALYARIDPLLSGLVDLNRQGIDDQAWVATVRRLAGLPALPSTRFLAVAALDRRLGGEPELRRELVERAVAASGAALLPDFAAPLERMAFDPNGEADGLRLLVAAVDRLGVAPGDLLRPRLAGLSLEQLAHLRRTLPMRAAAAEADRRLVELVAERIRATADFESARAALGLLRWSSLTADGRALLEQGLAPTVARDPARRAEVDALLDPLAGAATPVPAPTAVATPTPQPTATPPPPPPPPPPPTPTPTPPPAPTPTPPPVHAVAVALGDGKGLVIRNLGSPSDREEGLRRSDLSPAADRVPRGRVKGSDEKGFSAFAYPDGLRLLFRDGSLFRMVLDDTRGSSHHGVEVGLPCDRAASALGPPADRRAFIGDRALLIWRGLDDGRADLGVVCDDGRVVRIIEEEAGTADRLAGEVYGGAAAAGGSLPAGGGGGPTRSAEAAPTASPSQPSSVPSGSR
jgi:hypothetical protein